MMTLRNILLGLAMFLSMASFAQLPEASTIAAQMYPGWNLGNTMEAANNGQNFGNNVGLAGETSWQGTKTTKALIEFVKSQGFRSVRIPCNWVCGHISEASTVTIDATWMTRVKEVVDYCVDAGLYVVLNDHYDGGWVEKSFVDLSNSTVRKNADTMKAIWTQIALCFKDYDEHLLFAGLNEPDVDNQAKTDVLIRYEQAFIDAVRATGGNNKTRTLIVQGPGTDINKTVKFYSMPKDKVKGRLMLEVHYYDPFGFTHCHFDGNNGENSAKKGDWNYPVYFWGEGNHVTGGSWENHNATWGEEAGVKTQFDKMKTNFVDKGIPVYIGEYGTSWRELKDTLANKKHNASIKLFHKTVCQEAINHGLIPVVWDINACHQQGTHGTMTVIDRSAKSVFDHYAMSGIQEGVKAARWGGQTSVR